VFARAEPIGPGGDERDVAPELHVGGAVGWRLPLPGGLAALLGLGALGTVMGQPYEVGSAVALEASRLRVVWTAGVAWSPVG
jgi:hypothetical protein